ncbi:MAG: hypothetical protein HQL63_04585 [Magnetococcales bacterium]|nr:hypothetical protein [Magnetococcales bacterium]
MRCILRRQTCWMVLCCVAVLTPGPAGSVGAQEWPGGSEGSTSASSSVNREQPSSYQGQGIPYINSQAEQDHWAQRRPNNASWNQNQGGTGGVVWGSQEADHVPLAQPQAGDRRANSAWSGATRPSFPAQDPGFVAHASGYYAGPVAPPGGLAAGGGGDWSPLTDTGLLGIGVVGNGPEGLRRYLEDLRKWLGIKDAQKEPWEAFGKAATAFVTSRINPLTAIPDIHLNSVDWAKKRTEAFREWLQLREAVVASYEKLYAALDAGQKEHADRLSGFFR